MERMEGNTIPGASYGGLDLQHRQQPLVVVQPPMHDVFPLTMGIMNECTVGERAKTVTSDEDEPSYTEGGGDAGRGSKGPSSQWQRMKWNDTMVRLLITVVSYMGEDAALESNANTTGGRRKMAALQKKGKWKSVSKVLAERGYYVSPQQCEDKFNDLNKRYKRLTDILGRGTSCKVVENPTLLDVLDHLSDKSKETVRKILSSKHLFYEEMCSYHNGNRLHLPPDPSLQRSLQLALKSREDDEMHDTGRHQPDDVGEDDQDVDTDDHDHDDGPEEIHAFRGDNGSMFGLQGGSAKRMKPGHEHQDLSFGNPSTQHGVKRSYPQPQNSPVDMNQVIPEDNKADWMQKQWIKSRFLQLEEQKLQIQAQMLELEKQRFKWQRFSRKKDRELDELRMENERMKLENERMALELKRKELETGYN